MTLSETYRRLGNRERALQRMREAREAFEGSRRRGDVADFVLTQLAKLTTETPLAMGFLREALAFQQDIGNVMGEARTLLLAARIGDDRDELTAFRDRLLTLRPLRPALTNCPLMGEILEHWDKWTDGAQSPSGSDDNFWGL